MKLIIVRHGETDRNRSEQHIGPVDIPLNAVGETQAAAVGRRLRAERIDIIYSSDLLRAKQTTAAIAAFHPGVPVVFDPALRERDSGIYAARPAGDHKAAMQASGLSRRDWKPAGGESLREVKARAGEWYARHCDHDQDAAIVIVSHGFFLSLLMEWALEDGADVEKEEYRHHNAAVTILDIPQGGRATPIILNDTKHLT